jgi:hypothetical protein
LFIYTVNNKDRLNYRRAEMNTYRRLKDILHADKTMIVILGGIILSGIGFVSTVITAGLWFL